MCRRAGHDGYCVWFIPPSHLMLSLFFPFYRWGHWYLETIILLQTTGLLVTGPSGQVRVCLPHHPLFIPLSSAAPRKPFSQSITSYRGCCSGLQTPQPLCVSRQQCSENPDKVWTGHPASAGKCRPGHLWPWLWERSQILHRSHERSRRKFRPLV